MPQSTSEIIKGLQPSKLTLLLVAIEIFFETKSLLHILWNHVKLRKKHCLENTGKSEM